jgi:periplasmic divalent cation tolerance protein
MPALAILVTTVDSLTQAQRLTRAVIEKKLAACVHITPLVSHYIWQDAYCEANEFKLEMKLRAEDYPVLADFVRSVHNYETPEIIRIAVDAVEPAYLAWVYDATQRHAGDRDEL